MGQVYERRAWIAILCIRRPCAGWLGDVTYDDTINTDDLLLVLSYWGACP